MNVLNFSGSNELSPTWLSASMSIKSRSERIGGTPKIHHKLRPDLPHSDLTPMQDYGVKKSIKTGAFLRC